MKSPDLVPYCHTIDYDNLFNCSVSNFKIDLVIYNK